MTVALSIIGVIALLWLGRIAIRAFKSWRAERALKRRERQVQLYVMGSLKPTKEKQP